MGLWFSQLMSTWGNFSVARIAAQSAAYPLCLSSENFNLSANEEGTRIDGVVGEIQSLNIVIFLSVQSRRNRIVTESSIDTVWKWRLCIVTKNANSIGRRLI